MLITVHCAKCVGINAVPVTVEVDMASGIGIHLGGLADAAVKESLLRTITALQSMGFKIPGRKIVINLAPADLKKEGAAYDLGMAVGILTKEGIIKEEPKNTAFIGELSLDGSIKPVHGVLPIVFGLKNIGINKVIIPYENLKEASFADDIKVLGAKNLNEVVLHLNDNEPLEK